MGRKRHTAEQIIGKLRTAEIELAGGALVEAFTRAQPRRTERSWMGLRVRGLCAAGFRV